MVKTTRVASVATLAGLGLGLCLLAAPSPAQAKTTSDQPAAILYWPKIVVDTAGTFTGGIPTDTLIRLSNTCDPQVEGNPCYQGGTGLFGMKQARLMGRQDQGPFRFIRDFVICHSQDGIFKFRESAAF